MKKALVIGVATIALIAFSGLAVGDVWYTYYVEYNSRGWKDYGMIGNYHMLGKYNYREKQVYSIDYGWAYLSYHYVHSSYDIKYLDGNKPITISHYNCIYRYKAEIADSAGTLKWSKKAIGYYRIIDPKASDLLYGGIEGPEWFMQDPFTPFVTKFMDHRPNVEDATTLISVIFENVDIALIPLIEYAYFEIGANTIEMDFSWY